MAILALIVLAVWLVVVAGLRTYIGYRQTGTVATPVRPETGSPAWWAKLISSVGAVLAFAAPIAELLGRILTHRPLAQVHGGFCLSGSSFVAAYRGQRSPGARSRGIGTKNST